jgi:hypothetical protein
MPEGQEYPTLVIEEGEVVLVDIFKKFYQI